MFYNNKPSRLQTSQPVSDSKKCYYEKLGPGGNKHSSLFMTTKKDVWHRRHLHNDSALFGEPFNDGFQLAVDHDSLLTLRTDRSRVGRRFRRFRRRRLRRFCLFCRLGGHDRRRGGLASIY
jgi:hypothetical protein